MLFVDCETIDTKEHVRLPLSQVERVIVEGGKTKTDLIYSLSGSVYQRNTVK